MSAGQSYIQQNLQARVGANGELILTIPPKALDQLGLHPGSLVNVTLSNLASPQSGVTNIVTPVQPIDSDETKKAGGSKAFGKL
jgi:hypothetical protein